MACYKRIYYIDYCDNGGRQTNAGFVKLVQWKKGDNGRGEGTCLQVYISEFLTDSEMTCEVKAICDLREISLGQVVIMSGKGMAQIACLEEVIGALEREGGHGEILLRVELAADRYFECVLKAAADVPEGKTVLEAAEVVEETVKEAAEEREVHGTAGEDKAALPGRENTVPQEEAVIRGSVPQQSEPIPEKRETEIRPPARDKWQQLWTVFPHIRPFEDEREYLKMELQDMMILPNAYYRVIENSFLLHGYYNYGHLILTKIYKNGRERCYIGVPGNYYEREAQVAVMFGFESFEPKEEPAKEGDFGYYMIGVEI